uniref:Uncharacterized protein n=1 Tax=Suricata suricatta TaxID=37032 RepID=A0A673T2F0_SURSU
MVQYKLLLGCLLKSGPFLLLANLAFVYSSASVFLLNGLLRWHLSLFTCMPCAVYILHSFPFVYLYIDSSITHL